MWHHREGYNTLAPPTLDQERQPVRRKLRVSAVNHKKQCEESPELKTDRDEQNKVCVKDLEFGVGD